MVAAAVLVENPPSLQPAQSENQFPPEPVREKTPQPPPVTEAVFAPDELKWPVVEIPPAPKPQTKDKPPSQTAAATTSATSSPRGDGSSIKPGLDATTIEAPPAPLAKPNYLKNPEPDYPPRAKQRGQQGLVLLEVRVTAKGRAAEITIKQSSGHPLLDEAATKAVRDWEFEPAKVGLIAVESRIEVPIRYRLDR